MVNANERCCQSCQHNNRSQNAHRFRHTSICGGRYENKSNADPQSGHDVEYDRSEHLIPDRDEGSREKYAEDSYRNRKYTDAFCQ